ncbi:glyoxal oxidase [Mycena metata]|uniref:Glyoxal oxidase n=1 Tax=Mycena metata TaxID=1033252 RepID=A0AAD7MMZ3_9AGAR|nr:glyoxal oxidase [Mycena metata]
MSRASLVLVLVALGSVLAQDSSTASAQQPTATTLSAPSQPSSTGALGEFELIGNTLVSAQQMFLGTLDKVYILDKVENNAAKIGGHPAWASEYALGANSQRAMDAITNTFCAGGNVLGNGTWINIGGNAAIGYGGALVDGTGPYEDPDGGKSIRTLIPCDDGQCGWIDGEQMTTRRWYPTVETLADGTAIIIGGCNNGGYVNDAGQDNPTYEFYPSTGSPITSPFLANNLPINLYPLTYLLPSGKVLMQANRATMMLDPKTHKEYQLDDMPDAVRAYPASAGNIMLPLTPANNWTATVLFCGGSDNDDWSTDWNIAALPASASCVRITPDRSKSYTQDDSLPEGRSMGSLVSLPDGRVLCLNGAKMGTAGYGNQSWAIGQSYADSPLLTPVMYDPSAPNGTRWDRTGLSASTVPRMYHSSALLLPDGAVLVAGSNPNSDYNVGSKIKYPTEYRIEKFYPSYYNERRPQPAGLLSQLSYGGQPFDVSLSSDDLSGDAHNAANATVVIIRPGFSTHGMSMGQRFVQLDSTYTAYEENNTAALHVSQLPPNPAILAPGPALLFVVVNGVPSVGVQIMVGSGSLGAQPILAIGDLPSSSFVATPSNQGSGSSAQGHGSNSASSSSCGLGLLWTLGLGLGLALAARTLLASIC